MTEPAPTFTLARHVLRKEVTELVRDGRLGVVLLLSALLVLGALVFGWRDASRAAHERTSAQHDSESHWVEQGEKNPHVAAHYGLWVFKPSGALAALDPGVSPHLGAALKLEAHRQNLAVASAAEDSIGIQRFGPLTAASVLQLLGPLLVIALGFALWSSERERGTLRLLRAGGASLTALSLGKSLALAAAVALMLVPAVVGALAAVAAVNAGGTSGATPGAANGTAARLAVLVTVYLAYFFVFMRLTVAVSAWASRSRDALVVLVATWGVTALLVPRASAEVAALVVPLPSQDAFAAEVASSLARGLPDQPGRVERLEELTKSMMAEQGFADADVLMDDALLQGIELRAEAAYEDEVFEWHVTRLMQALSRQEAVGQWMSVLSPTLAVRSLSAALCGTDFEHHRDFAAHAEQYRRTLVDRLNRDFAENAGRAGWDYRAGRALWESAPRFEYALPSVPWVLRWQLPAVGWLLGWAGVSALLAHLAVRRQRVGA